MEIKVKTGKPELQKTGAIVVGIFEGTKKLSGDAASLDKALGGIISEAIKQGDFKGKLNETYLVPVMGRLPVARLLLTGLGKEKEFTLERLRQASGKSAQYLAGLGLTSFSTTLHSLLKPLDD